MEKWNLGKQCFPPLTNISPFLLMVNKGKYSAIWIRLTKRRLFSQVRTHSVASVRGLFIGWLPLFFWSFTFKKGIHLHATNYLHQWMNYFFLLTDLCRSVRLKDPSLLKGTQLLKIYTHTICHKMQQTLKPRLAERVCWGYWPADFLKRKSAEAKLNFY